MEECRPRRRKRGWREEECSPGTLLVKGAITAHLQDALVPFTARLFGNCHWNRDTAQVLRDAGFQIRELRERGGWVQLIILIQATIAEQDKRE